MRGEGVKTQVQMTEKENERVSFKIQLARLRSKQDELDKQILEVQNIVLKRRMINNG